MSKSPNLFADEIARARYQKFDRLSHINHDVDWAKLRPILRAIWHPNRDYASRSVGRKPIDEVIVFRILLLGVLENMSMRMLEVDLLSNRFHMEFVGLTDSSRTPNRSTLSRYRRRLKNADSLDVLRDLCVKLFASIKFYRNNRLVKTEAVLADLLGDISTQPRLSE